MTLQVTHLPYTRRRFTVAEYERLGEVGILTEDDRVELIDGEIIDVSPIGRWHASHVVRLTAIFVRAFGDSAQVSIQNPLHLSEDSEPQPDLMLLRPESDFYASSHPTPADVFLIVEIADSSVEYDRGIKLPRYARAGIPEVWLLSPESDGIAVYRDPSPDGYQTSALRRRGEWLSSLALPGRELAVAELVG